MPIGLKYFLVAAIVLMAFLNCAKSVKLPTVETVYPTATVLPENLLRMYVQFSQPMKTVGNLEKIKLIDAKGEKVKNIFFNNVHELWNKDQTQLTLLLDPARVKTGLRANQSLGRALVPGNNYTLVIDGLEDVHHQKMSTPFMKKIAVRKADVQIPDTKNWNFLIPLSNSKGSLKIHFSDMLDYNSLQQRLMVTNLENQPIKGTISIQKNETEWNFVPEEIWSSGIYLLHVNFRLEDPSGNNLNGLFDHNIGSLKYKKEGVVVSVPFKIK